MQKAASGTGAGSTGDDGVKSALDEATMRSRANSAQRQPRAVQAGSLRQGRIAKLITREDMSNPLVA